MSAQASADFEVYGYDFTATDKVSAELKEKLLQVKGVSEVNISRQDYQPEYQVDFDRDNLADSKDRCQIGMMDNWKHMEL